MYTDNLEEEILFIPARKDGEALDYFMMKKIDLIMN